MFNGRCETRRPAAFKPALHFQRNYRCFIHGESPGE
jgi:hypothetical protein